MSPLSSVTESSEVLVSSLDSWTMIPAAWLELSCDITLLVAAKSPGLRNPLELLVDRSIERAKA